MMDVVLCMRVDGRGMRGFGGGCGCSLCSKTIVHADDGGTVVVGGGGGGGGGERYVGDMWWHMVGVVHGMW